MSDQEWAEWARTLVEEVKEEVRQIGGQLSDIHDRLEALESFQSEMSKAMWSVSKVDGRLQVRATLPVIPHRWLIVGGGVVLAVVARLGGLDLDLRQLLELLGN